MLPVETFHIDSGVEEKSRSWQTTMRSLAPLFKLTAQEAIVAGKDMLQDKKKGKRVRVLRSLLDPIHVILRRPIAKTEAPGVIDQSSDISELELLCDLRNKHLLYAIGMFKGINDSGRCELQTPYAEGRHGEHRF